MGKAWEAAKEVRLANGEPVIGPYLGRVIDTLSRQLVPDGGELGVDIGDTRAHQFLALYLSGLESGARFGVKALLVIFDLLPFLFIQRFSRFTRLRPAEQELYLKDWEASRIYYRRMVLVLLKTVMGMGFYNDAKVLAAIGFGLPCGERKP